MILVEERAGKLNVKLASFEDVCEAVYSIVLLIPIGHVTYYKNIAKLLGIHPRLVAKCLARNRNIIVVPCHRVIYKNGGIGGYSALGSDFKEKLLSLEGVEVVNHRVSKKNFFDLGRFLN